MPSPIMGENSCDDKTADVRAWMPLYVRDWDAKTAFLTCEEDGAYGRLVRFYWYNGRLADDDAQLARIVRMPLPRWRKVRASIAPFFIIKDGLWLHGRVEEELCKARTLSAKRQSAGSAGSTARWGKSDGLTRSQRLTEARKSGTHTELEWGALVEILGDICVKCETPIIQLFGGGVCKDHVVPLFKGGGDGIDNLQPLCRECNAGKGSDETDHRFRVTPDWPERLAKRLAKPLAKVVAK